MIRRPHNETEADLQREEAARAFIADCWRCDATKLREELYGIDWMFERGRKVVAVGEFKGRPTKKYATLQIGAAKCLKGITVANWLGVPFLLFVRWLDEPIVYFRYDESKTTRCIVTNPRGQPGDREPGIEIAGEHFSEVRRGLSPPQGGSRGQHSRSPLKSENGRQG